MNKLILIAFAFATPALLACSPRDHDQRGAQANPKEVTPRVSETEKPGLSQPGDLSPAAAQARVDDVVLGRSLNAMGGIDPAYQGDAFAAGETILLSMKVGDAPAGSAIRAVWTGPNDLLLDRQTKTVGTGMPYLSFTAPVSTGWAKGDYKVDVFIGDENVSTKHFNIVDADKTDKS